MILRLTRKSVFLSTLLLAIALSGPAIAVQAARHGGGQGMQGGMQQHRGMQGGCMHCGGKGLHGKQPGKGQGGGHLLGDHWKKTLTAEQKAQLDLLHVRFAKTKAPLKAGIRALKAQLAVLATAGEPQMGAIDAKIDELLMAKRELMRAKYLYITAQRRVLNPQQQTSFDMALIHKVMHGKKGKSGRGGKH